MKQAIRTSVYLWCHNYTVTNLSHTASFTRPFSLFILLNFINNTTGSSNYIAECNWMSRSQYIIAQPSKDQWLTHTNLQVLRTHRNINHNVSTLYVSSIRKTKVVWLWHVLTSLTPQSVPTQNNALFIITIWSEWCACAHMLQSCLLAFIYTGWKQEN